MTLTDEQYHDLDFTYHTLSWNIIQGRLEGDDTKRPDLPNFRDYFDSKQTVPYEALVEHMKQANKLLMVVLGKQRDGKYTLTCWDIDTKDENIRRLFLHYYPSSLWQETRDGYHFFFGIQGDPDEVRRYFESKDLLGKQYSITDDIKVEVYTANRAIAFIGERYGKLQGNLEFLKKEDFCDAKVAFIHALYLYAYLKDYYKPDYRDKIVFRLSGILAKKRIPKHIGLNIIDGLASIFNDEERKSRLKVTEDSYKDYADGKPLNTKLEEVIPKDVAKKIYEYFDYRPTANGNNNNNNNNNNNKKKKHVLIIIDRKDTDALYNYSVFTAIMNQSMQEAKSLPVHIINDNIQFYALATTYKRISHTLKYNIIKIKRSKTNNKIFKQIDYIIIFGSNDYVNSVIKRIKKNKDTNIITGNGKEVAIRLLLAIDISSEYIIPLLNEYEIIRLKPLPAC